MIPLSSSATCNGLVNAVTLEPVGSVIASNGRVTDELFVSKWPLLNCEVLYQPLPGREEADQIKLSDK
jgi:hypothetical protein